MGEVTMIGLDLAKHVFQVHGVDAEGATVLRKQLRRAQVLAFFSRLPRCLVGMEACGTAHYWARELRALGHEVGLVNALRAHWAEFGIIAPQGLRHVGRLTAIVRDEGDARLPDLARQVLQVLAAQIEQLEAAVAAIEKQLMAWHKSNPVSQRLASVPGIGPIIATAIAATVVEPSGFRCARE